MHIKLRVHTPNLSALRSLLADADVDMGCTPITERSGQEYAITVISDKQEHHRLVEQLPPNVYIDVLEELPATSVPPGTIGRGNRFLGMGVPRGLGTLAASYLNYDELVTGLQVLADTYRQQCELVVLPHPSVETRSIYALAIGANRGPSVPTAIYVGGIHAREWVPPDALFYLCADLLEAHTSQVGLTYGTARFSAVDIQRVFSNLQLVILPCANPDGRVYSLGHVSERWRKNRARYTDSCGRACVGVDLNRNFDFAWDFRRTFAPTAANASDNPRHGTYVGPSPASEPETRNITWLFDQYIDTRWYLDIHSSIPAILHPWSIDENQTHNPEMNFLNSVYDRQRGNSDGTNYREFIKPEDLTEFRRLGYLMADEIQRVGGDVYQVASSLSLCPPLYACPGTSKDYAYSRHRIDRSKSKIFSFTLECGHSQQAQWHEAERVIPEVSAAAISIAVDASSSVGLNSHRTVSRSKHALTTSSSRSSVSKDKISMKTHWIINNGPPSGFRWQGQPEFDPQSGRRLEAVIADPNFKALWWLRKAFDVARCVARVKFPNGSATGFLVGPDMFLTNNHVFENEEDAKRAILQFNYQLEPGGSIAPVDEWRCDPDSFFQTSPELDYAIVRVTPKDHKTPGKEWGFLDLYNGATVSVGQRVNIIQHPQGRFKEIAFRDNQVRAADPDEPFIQYITDTDYGTSGSPVFDDWFNVVALHSQRVPDPTEPRRWYRNQGFRIQAILADLGDVLR